MWAPSHAGLYSTVALCQLVLIRRKTFLFISGVVAGAGNHWFSMNSFHSILKGRNNFKQYKLFPTSKMEDLFPFSFLILDS